MDKEFYQDLLLKAPFGYAYHEMIFDELGNPIDYRFIEVNQSFESYTGFVKENVIGKKVTEIIPNIRTLDFDWVNYYGNLVKNNQSEEIVRYSPILKRYYKVNTYTYENKYFANFFVDISENENAEIELQKSKATLNKIMDSIKQSVFWKDMDGVYLGCNQAFATGAGLKSPADIIGKNDFEMPWKEFAELYRADDKEVLSKNQMKDNIIEPITLSDGSNLWIETTKVAITDENNQPFAVLGVFNDITEKKKLDDKIKLSEKHLKEVQSIAQLGSYTLDVNTGYWESSEVLDIIFGIDKDYDKSVSGWVNIIHPDHQQMMNEYFANEVIGQRKKFEKEYKIIRKNDNEVRWVYGVGELTIDQNGSPTKMIGMIQDVTEKREYIIKIENLSNLVANSINEIFIFDLDTLKFIYANKAGIDNLQYSLEELHKMTPVDIKPEFTVEGFLRFIEELKNKKVEKLVFETVHKRKDKSLYNVEVQLQIAEFNGELAFVANILDVTSKRESEIEFKTVLETIFDGYFVVDVNRRIIDANKGFCDMLQYTYEEITQLHVNDIEYIESIEDTERRIQTILHYGFDRFETLHKRKDGSMRNVEVSIKLLRFNNPRMLVFARDITQRKVDEQKIKESEEKYRIIFQDSSDAYLIIENDVFIDCNSAAARMLKMKEKDIIGKLPEELSPEYQANGMLSSEYARELIQMTLKSGKVQFEWQHLRGDGQVFWVEVYLTKMHWNDKDVLFTSWRDITIQKEALSQLIESEEKFRQIADNVSEVFWLRNADNTKMIYINKAYEQVWGRSCQSLMDDPNSFILSVYDEDKPRVFAEFEKYMNNGGFDIEYRIVKPNNEIRWVKAASFPVKDINGNIIRHTGVAADITDRKKLESDLINAKNNAEKNEELLKEINDELISRNVFIQTIMDNLPIGIALNKLDEGIATYMNKKFEEIYGWANSEITSIATFFERVYPEENYRNEIISRIMEDINSGDTSRMHWENIRVTRKDGTQRIVNAVNIPLFEQNTMVSSVIDITELHKIQEELLSAKIKAEESEKLKSAFLANMSHEIRTPMNGIIGFMSLLKQPNLSGDEINEYIEIVNLSGQRLLDTINDIIEISKIDAGQVQIHNSEVNIYELMNFMHTFFRVQTNNKNLEFTLVIDDIISEDVIYSDRNKLNSILTNLIKNAIKFTKAGFIEFGCKIENDNLIFYVADSGIGIAMDRQQAIFERFVQAELDYNRPHEGSGLGLSIVSAFVNMLKGKIWLESEKDKGSKFYFSIPYQKVNNVKKIDDDEYMTETVQKNDFTILIAEDDDISFSFLNKILKKEGIDIVHAINGLEVLEILAKNSNISMVLMDIKMKGMNGLEATRKIRESNNNIPIIAQTAYALSGDRELALAAGCNDHITKPINRDLLLDIINRYRIKK